MSVIRGRLLSSVDAPTVGERSQEIARVGGVVVEQILSGSLPSVADYNQDHDEWVLVLEGAGRLEVGGEHLDLSAGDWVLLPAHVSHRLLETVPGTSWLALHACASDHLGPTGCSSGIT